MNLVKKLYILLFLIVGSASLPVFCMEDPVKQGVKVEKLYDDQLYERIFKDFFCRGSIKNLSTFNVQTIESLFAATGEGPLYHFVSESNDKEKGFFSLCHAMSRFLKSTSIRLREMFLRLAKYGIDPATSEDPISAFFHKLKENALFSPYFERLECTIYLTQWNELLIKERINVSMPTASNKPRSTGSQNCRDRVDVEAVFEGDQKKLINVGGTIDIELQKGSVVLVCDAGSNITIEKIHPEANITIKDQKFLERMSAQVTQSAQMEKPQQDKEGVSFVEESKDITTQDEHEPKGNNLTSLIGKNLTFIAPLTILGSLAALYCVADMPGISIIATASVIYLTNRYQAVIERLYNECTQTTNQEKTNK